RGVGGEGAGRTPSPPTPLPRSGGEGRNKSAARLNNRRPGRGGIVKEIDYAAPKTIAEAVTLFTDRGDRARALAGGTDIIVQVRENRRDLDLLIDLKNIPEVNELSYDPGKGLRLGAAVPCHRVYERPEIARAYPALHDA